MLSSSNKYELMRVHGSLCTHAPFIVQPGSALESQHFCAAIIPAKALFCQLFFQGVKEDELVKSPKMPFSVIPVKTGIQGFQEVMDSCSPPVEDAACGARGQASFSGSDGFRDFLRTHQGGWTGKPAESRVDNASRFLLICLPGPFPGNRILRVPP